MPTDIIDLVDPIRLLLMLLPERYRGPAAVLLTVVAATQAIASLVVARLPLSAREHPRYGRIVRALHWYAVVRLRDELGSLKAIGADVGPRVTVAPDVVAEALRITRESERGYATVRALLAVVMTLAVVGVALAGCPRLPEVSGCQPESQTCIADRPHVCSASQRWQPAGDLACSAVGGVCAVAGGRAYCAPLTDGGVR